jgi:lipid A 3-O-deacylase
MKGRRLILALLLILAKAIACAQGDSTAHSGNLRISYNNDTFTYTDRYYTHGFRVELSRHSLNKLPTRHLLLRLRHSNLNLYGISLTQDAFTPSSIRADHRLYGDRPYAAYAHAGLFLVSENTFRKLRTTTELNAGVLGPWACGYEVQAEFHKIIGDKHPQGWEKQIANDVVLNYGVKIEKALLASGSRDITAYTELNAGTLYTNAVSGIEVRSGRLGSWSYNTSSRWRAFIFVKAQMKAVGYNATLQGGLLNRNNSYTAEREHVQRFVPGAQAGVVFSYKKIGVEYGYVYQGKELKYGMPHSWGHAGVKIGL